MSNILDKLGYISFNLAKFITEIIRIFIGPIYKKYKIAELERIVK